MQQQQTSAQDGDSWSEVASPASAFVANHWQVLGFGAAMAAFWRLGTEPARQAAKHVGEARTELKADIAVLRAEMKQTAKDTRAEMRDDLKELRDEMRVDMKELRDDMRNDLKELRDDMRGESKELRDDMQRVRDDMKQVRDALSNRAQATPRHRVTHFLRAPRTHIYVARY